MFISCPCYMPIVDWQGISAHVSHSGIQAEIAATISNTSDCHSRGKTVSLEESHWHLNALV